jgi:hypothetical protein
LDQKEMTMKTIFAIAATLSIGAASLAGGNGPSLRGHAGAQVAESSGASVGGRDTALFAEGEGNGRSPGARDTAQFAEGNGVSPGGHDTAVA